MENKKLPWIVDMSGKIGVWLNLLIGIFLCLTIIGIILGSPMIVYSLRFAREGKNKKEVILLGGFTGFISSLFIYLSKTNVIEEQIQTSHEETDVTIKGDVETYHEDEVRENFSELDKEVEEIVENQIEEIKHPHNEQEDGQEGNSIKGIRESYNETRMGQDFSNLDKEDDKLDQHQIEEIKHLHHEEDSTAWKIKQLNKIIIENEKEFLETRQRLNLHQDNLDENELNLQKDLNKDVGVDLEDILIHSDLETTKFLKEITKHDEDLK